MLRTITITAILMALLVSTRAQDQQVLNNQYLKFQRVVAYEGKSKEELLEGLRRIVFQLYDSVEIKSISDYRIFVESDLKVSNTLIGKLGNPAGKLDFKMAVEVKDNKFRYSLYDFFFTPIERDRYGRYNLVKKEPVAVNEQNYEGQQTLLKKIISQSRAYAGRLDDRLKEYLSLAYADDKKW